MSTKTSAKKTAAPRFKIGMMATSHYGPRLARFHKKTLALWAADCAEHVLPHFERLRSFDDRPRKAVDAARAWARGEITMMAARAAAVNTHAAARDSDHPAAVAAARSAGHAAGTAHSIRHARGAAAYAIVSAVAAVSDRSRILAETRERDWQISRFRSPK